MRHASAVVGIAVHVGRGAAARPSRSGVKLLRPDSLAGWEYGAAPPAIGRIKRGQLDRQRAIDAAAFAAGRSAISSCASGGPSLWGGLAASACPTFRRGPACKSRSEKGMAAARCATATRTWPPGIKIDAAPAGAMHTADIRRSGRHAVGDRRRQ